MKSSINLKRDAAATNDAVFPISRYRTRLRGLFEVLDAQTLSALFIYLVISLLVFGLPVIRHFTTSYIGWGADPTIFLWAIAWWPHAVMSRINPFITREIWAPTGCNLAWVTSIPGPSLVMTPVTMLFGPVVSYNVLNILCPLANAFSAFLLCRYVGKRFWPAMLGGYIFEFSQYTLSQSLGHLFLLFIFPVPLAILLVLRRMNRDLGRLAFVVLMTAVLAFEFLSSTEVFATTSVLGTFIMVLSYLLFGTETRRALEKVAFEIAVTYAILVLVLSPYLYYVFAMGVPPPINSSIDYSNDLLALFVPTPVIFIGGEAFRAATGMMRRSWGEMSGYLGPGVWVVIVLFTRSNWRKPFGKLLTLRLALIAVLSMGPALHVLGATSIPMPWWLFSKLPLIDQALPGRFGMYLAFDAALIACIYFSETKNPPWLRIGLASLSLLFLVADPAWRKVSSAAADEPLFCRSGEYKQYIAPGDNVLFLPHGGESMSLLWQAESGFYYRIPTGHVGMIPPTSADWPILESFIFGDEIPDFSEQLEAFLGANRVRTIIVEKHKQDRWPRLLAKLHITPVSVDGVLLYRVPPEILNSFASATPHEMAERDGVTSVTMLVQAASRYLGSDFAVDKLSPFRARQLHMLDLPEDALIEEPENNWWHNLWLGPAPNSSVGIGIVGRYEDLQLVVQSYRPYAREILFPYPKPLGNPPPDESGQLFMIFDREGLSRAATTGGEQPIIRNISPGDLSARLEAAEPDRSQ